MPRIRLTASVSIAPEIGVVQFRTGVRTVQIDTPHVKALATDVLPLLDGSHDKQKIRANVKGFSHASVSKFLRFLERNGLIEVAQNNDCTSLKTHVSEQQKLRRLVASCLNERSGIIKYLNLNPPDSAKLNMAWTSAVILNLAESATGTVLKETGFGAGLTALEAMTKAVAEALELYAARQCSQTDLRYCSLSDLDQDFLDPRQLSLYQLSQYRKPRFPYSRFTSRMQITWTRGSWLDSGQRVWLPAHLTYFRVDLSGEPEFSQVTTSGLAAGTTIENASLHAILELAERDAFITTWLCQLPSRRLLPDASLDHASARIISRFERQGMEVRFYLLENEINIPVVLCVVLGDGRQWPGATIGLGAGANCVTATGKALLEQALIGPAMRREMLAGKRVIPKRPQNIKTPLDHALYYTPKERARAFDFLDSKKMPAVSLSDLELSHTISLAGCLDRLRAAGVRVAIKDLTPSKFSTRFRVVRALATKLQPIHFGFDLARLGNPRLSRMMKKGINPHPHPLA